MITLLGFPLYGLAILIGGLPTGYWFARWKGIIDIRQYGSGNIGATNVGRILGMKYFFVVFFIDVLKAFVFVMFLKKLNIIDGAMLFIVTGLILGNCFSPLLQGKGGKGVSTSIGIIAALNAFIIPIIFSVWTFVFLITRTVGIASVVGFLCLPFITVLIDNSSYIFGITVILSMCGMYRHKTNIRNYFKVLVNNKVL